MSAPAATVLGLAAVAALLLAYLVLAGDPLPPAEVLAALVGSADAGTAFAVTESRLPRALVALAAGAMLAVSGALLQAVVRNPLAAPELTGVSAGAVVAAVAWTGIAGTGAGRVDLILPAVATAGGALAAGAVYLTARRHGRTDPLRLVLVGAVLAGILAAVTTLLILLTRRDPDDDTFVTWLVGSLTLRSWSELWTLAPYLVLAGVLLLAAVPRGNLLQLGDGLTHGLGVRPERARILVLATAVLLAAGAVSVVGAVGFVGLVGPHVARLLGGGDLRRLVPLSALAGGLLLLGADLAARAVRTTWLPFADDAGLRAADLPVGVFTALLGVPLFVHLLRRAGRRAAT
jgi:iron complex transport system permease protein